MGRNSQRRRTLAAQSRIAGPSGAPSQGGNRASRRHPRPDEVHADSPSLQDDATAYDHADPANY